MPLYVFCGSHLLASYLRPSNIDGAKHTWAILALLVKRLRQQWPDIHITFTGDSGFCHNKMLTWCDRHKVDYIVGMPKNNRLMQAIEPEIKAAESDFLQTLADHHNEMIPEMLEELIDQLPEEQLFDLLAIVFVGRGDYEVDEWEQALETARHPHKEHPGHYLLTMPRIVDYLEEGLALIDD